MWWHIVVFSIMFGLFVVQQFEIDRLNKYIKHIEGKVDKHNDAILQILRGF